MLKGILIEIVLGMFLLHLTRDMYMFLLESTGNRGVQNVVVAKIVQGL